MSDCACVYSSYDGDCAKVSNVEVLTARKEHVCCECHGTIQRGEQYQRTSGLWEGGWTTYKTCLPCVEIRDALCCDGFNYTALWEDIHECLPRITVKCLEKLTTAAAKEKLTAQWRKWNDL